METVLYADILFLVNFAMDFIALSASASLGAKEKNPIRISLASALGAIYAIFATISSLNGIAGYIISVLVGGAMCVICFDFGGIIPFLRQYAVFGCCSALLGGIMTMLLSWKSPQRSPFSIFITAIAAIGILFFMIRAISHRAGCKSLHIKITLNGKTTAFDALCDSGNLLRDPFSCAPVILTSHEALYSIIPRETVKAMLGGFDAVLHKDLKIRLIPQSSDNGGKLLCAFFPDNVTVSHERRTASKKCLIAVSPHSNTYFAGFAATAPSILIP